MAASRSRPGDYVLRLYVSRSTVRSTLAVRTIRRVCKVHLQGKYALEVIDIHRHPNLARDEQIVAVPTLIKRLPPPLQRLVGDMSDLNTVLLAADKRVHALRQILIRARSVPADQRRRPREDLAEVKVVQATKDRIRRQREFQDDPPPAGP